MANDANPITVGTTAVQLTGNESPYAKGGVQTVVVRPMDGDIYLGGTASVTTAAGFPVKQDEVFAIDAASAVYAIAAANVAVRVFRTNVIPS
jgi:hypothetical protein